MIEGLKLQKIYNTIFHFCRRSFYDRRLEITNPIYKNDISFLPTIILWSKVWNYKPHLQNNISFLPTIILWSKVWNYKLKLRTQYFLSADDHFMIKGLKFEFEKCTLCPKHIIWRGQIVPQTYNANVIFCQRSIRLTVWKSLEHKSSRDRIVFFGNQLSI